MKLCPKCSAKNDNDASFCKNCGESLAEVPVTQEDISAIAGSFFNKAMETASAGAKKAQQVAADGAVKVEEHRQEVAAQKAEATAAKSAEEFIDPSETVKATLKASFVQSMLTGEGVEKSSAVLTEKRLYCKGELFSGSGKSISSVKGEYVIPVEDISMTSFIHGQDIGGRIIGIILLLIGVVLVFSFPPIGIISILAGVIFFFKSILDTSNILEVWFPGGHFRFDVKWYPLADMQEFQRQIHLARDSLKAGQKSGKQEEAKVSG